MGSIRRSKKHLEGTRPGEGSDAGHAESSKEHLHHLQHQSMQMSSQPPPPPSRSPYRQQQQQQATYSPPYNDSVPYQLFAVAWNPAMFYAPYPMLYPEPTSTSGVSADPTAPPALPMYHCPPNYPTAFYPQMLDPHQLMLQQAAHTSGHHTAQSMPHAAVSQPPDNPPLHPAPPLSPCPHTASTPVTAQEAPRPGSCHNLPMFMVPYAPSGAVYGATAAAGSRCDNTSSSSCRSREATAYADYYAQQNAQQAYYSGYYAQQHAQPMSWNQGGGTGTASCSYDAVASQPSSVVGNIMGTKTAFRARSVASGGSACASSARVRRLASSSTLPADCARAGDPASRSSSGSASGGQETRGCEQAALQEQAGAAERHAHEEGSALAVAGAGMQGSDSDEDAECWSFLTAAILQNVVSKLGDADSKQMRLVCRHWQGAVDHDIESLSPNAMVSRVLVRRFPNLKTLHLTNCPLIRNRDLMIISTSGLHLHTLTIGDDACRPWVTNLGLQHIAHISSLTSLNLHDCNNVTNAGLMALTSLQGLSSLSLKGCGKLTNAGLDALQRHSTLTSLNLYGCMRIADKGILALSHLRLVSLHLGNTKVKDEGLAYLAQITTLQELHFDAEELTDAGVAQLTSLTRLESLALRDCGEVSGDSLSVLVPALPNLMSLDLFKNFTMDDSQLSRCLEFLGAVTYLDLRGTPVTEDGLQQLTKLTSLQKLCLAPTKDDLWSQYLCVVSNLTQLTSLSINNCTLISFGQLETLRQLKLLRELDLSHDSRKDGSKVEELCSMQQQSVNPTAINAMAAITSLTSIDLSRRPMHEEHLNVLAERLPRLHTLIIVGCPVLYEEVQSLQRRFPQLTIHRRPLFDISCNSSDHGV